MAEKKAKTQVATSTVTAKEKKPLGFWTKMLLTLVTAGVIGLILSLILFGNEKLPTYASAKLQLTFEGAAEGIGPDGYVFDMRELTSDEVLSVALAETGLSGKYTVEQVRSGIVFEGSYPEDMVNQTMSYDSLLNFTASRKLTVDRFHPTTFRVLLYNHFDEKISKADLEKLLENLLKEFEKRFALVHTQGVPELGAEFEIARYDYPQQLEILEKQLNSIGSYATEMYEKEPVFRLEGRGFNDIAVRIDNLLDSDIERLNANITLNALTKDPERLLVQYQFEIRDMTSRLQNQQKELADLDALIESYQKSEIVYIAAGDTMTKIDGDSTKTYDELVDIRKDLAAQNTELSSKIAIMKHKMEDLMQEYSKDAGKGGENGEGNSQGDADNAGNGADGDSAGNGDGDSQSGEGDTQSGDDNTGTAMTPEEIAAAAKAEDAAMQKKREAFEKEVEALIVKRDAVLADLAKMIGAWNESKINALTVTTSDYKYQTKKILSGSFIKFTVKTAGPICALALIGCLVVIIVKKSREMKAEA